MVSPHIIRTALQEAVHDGVFPGAVLAVRVGGQERFILPVGRLTCDPESSPVTESTIYDLASLTKPLATVTSLLLLFQQGNCSLETSVEEVLQSFQGSAIGSATVRDLLTHSSGLPGWRPIYERLAQVGPGGALLQPDLLCNSLETIFRSEPLIYPRGSKSLYSDLGFILLGLMIEHMTGLPLDRWFDDAVAMPFGAPLLCYRPTMKFSSQLGGGEKTVTRIAPTESNVWRDGVTRHEVHDENAAAMQGVAGHAGLFGTAESVLAISDAWLKAYHSTGCRLEHSLVRKLVTRQNISNSSWALGWDTPSKDSSSGQYFSEQSFGHLGYTGTSLWIDPVKRIEVVLLSNRVHLGHDNNKIRTFRPRIHDLIMQECVM